MLFYPDEGTILCPNRYSTFKEITFYRVKSYDKLNAHFDYNTDFVYHETHRD